MIYNGIFLGTFLLNGIDSGNNCHILTVEKFPGSSELQPDADGHCKGDIFDKHNVKEYGENWN